MVREGHTGRSSSAFHHTRRGEPKKGSAAESWGGVCVSQISVNPEGGMNHGATETPSRLRPQPKRVVSFQLSVHSFQPSARQPTPTGSHITAQGCDAPVAHPGAKFHVETYPERVPTGGHRTLNDVQPFPGRVVRRPETQARRNSREGCGRKELKNRKSGGLLIFPFAFFEFFAATLKSQHRGPTDGNEKQRSRTQLPGTEPRHRSKICAANAGIAD